MISSEEIVRITRNMCSITSVICDIDWFFSNVLFRKLRYERLSATTISPKNAVLLKLIILQLISRIYLNSIVVSLENLQSTAVSLILLKYQNHSIIRIFSNGGWCVILNHFQIVLESFRSRLFNDFFRFTLSIISLKCAIFYFYQHQHSAMFSNVIASTSYLSHQSSLWYSNHCYYCVSIATTTILIF